MKNNPVLEFIAQFQTLKMQAPSLADVILVDTTANTTAQQILLET